jgi:alkylation response protein AidB-like acyl-CoA dehydrogenase
MQRDQGRAWREREAAEAGAAGDSLAGRPAERLILSLAPRAIVDEVGARFGAFVRQEIDPGAAARDRTAQPISRELLRQAGALGLLGFTIPTAAGGAGRSWREWAWVLHELGYRAADTAFPMLLAYLGTLTKMLHDTGRPDLIERYVRPMVRGERLGGFAWSEGRDPFAFRTRAERTASGGYVLDGMKGPIANALIADVFMVFARDTLTSDVVVVLVESDDPGVTITPHPATGLRASGMGRLALAGVAIPAERVLVTADGLSYGQRFLNERRLEMPCWALGRMRALLETCVAELADRIRYGLPLSEMQTVQAAIGRMFAGVETSRLVLDGVLQRVGQGLHDPLWDAPLALAKYHVIHEALALCRTLQDVLGGAAVLEADPYERPIRDLSCLNAIAGTLATLEVDLGVLTVADVMIHRHTAPTTSPPAATATTTSHPDPTKEAS